MKATFVSSLLIAASLLAGCSKPESAPPAVPPAAPVTVSGPRIIRIEVSAAEPMKYGVLTITAAPGEELKVILTNSTTIAKEVMGHNWVLLQAGSDAAAFATAGATAKDTDYVLPALKNQVLAQIAQLGPKQSGEVTFKAPTTPGEYPYLCTFPAHYALGMKGVLIVK